MYEFQRYLNVRSAGGASFSPDGRRISFLTDITGVPQLWAVPVQGGWPDQLTFFGERVSEAAYSPTDDQILFSMDAGGNERHALHLLRRDGADIIPLTHEPAAIHQFGGWSDDGRQIAYAANSRNAMYFDVYAGSPADATARRILQHDGTNYALGWTPDGKVIVGRYLSNVHNALYLVDANSDASAEPRLLTPDPSEALYQFPAATPDGRGLYLISDLQRDFAALMYLDLQTLELRVVDAPQWDVEELALSRDGTKLAYTINVDGYSELRIRDLTTGTPLPIPPLPPATYAQLAWSPDGTRLALTLNGPRDTADIWVLDLGEGRAWPVTRSARGGIPRDDLVDPEVIRYPSFDGRQIPALFFKPRGEQPPGGLPVVIEVHGGPESQRRPIWSAAIQYLAGRGYAVLSPNVRGSTGYGKTYMHLDDVRLRMDSVRDLAYAVEWLRQNGADPRRIAVIGGSYGGFMVLAAITSYPDLWAAAVDIVGIANFVTFLENTGPWRRALREAEYGSLERDREFLEQISPIHYVEKITAPLLVIHGANDPRVPVDEAEQIVGTLRARGRPVEYLRFDDEGHGLVKLPNRIAGYTAVGAFLDRWLLDNSASQ
ncbi:MAG TPA: S9 family peptidase [Chloroflexota bacterium]|nr:S9 family peptidase [Chloroflexota bacterium]